jgi:hypothetical protein
MKKQKTEGNGKYLYLLESGGKVHYKNIYIHRQRVMAGEINR